MRLLVQLFDSRCGHQLVLTPGQVPARGFRAHSGLPNDHNGELTDKNIDPKVIFDMLTCHYKDIADDLKYSDAQQIRISRGPRDSTNRKPACIVGLRCSVVWHGPY